MHGAPVRHHCNVAAAEDAGEGRIEFRITFSAQSNFTRFFLNQVGIPPSEYRRVYARAEVSP